MGGGERAIRDRDQSRFARGPPGERQVIYRTVDCGLRGVEQRRDQLKVRFGQ